MASPRSVAMQRVRAERILFQLFGQPSSKQSKAIMWNRARAALEEARALGVPTFNSSWFGGGTNASAAVLAPAQVAAIAPLVRVTAAYVVMYYAFCFFQSWSKLYLFAAASEAHLYAIDAINVINKTQAADAAPERRRQEADARAAEVRRLWVQE